MNPDTFVISMLENEIESQNWKTNAKLLKIAGSLSSYINKPNYVTEPDSTWNACVCTKIWVIVLKELYLDFIKKPSPD